MFKATIIILIWWMGLFFVFSCFGLLIRRFFGLKVQNTETCFLSFWIGWAFSILILQFWHFCFKVDVFAIIFISAISIAGYIWNYQELRKLIQAQLLKKHWYFILLILTISLWISNRSLGPINDYDSGLYHIPSIKWIATYPIVPGLGNLHGRLAFNSSYFLYVAMLDVGPFIERSQHIANGLLLLVLVIQIIFSIYKLFSGCNEFQIYHFFNSLLIAPVLTEVIGRDVSSPSPDLPIFVLGILVSSQLLLFILDSKNDIKKERYHLFYITVISCVGITVKLSFTIFGGATLLCAVGVWLGRNREQIKQEFRKTLLLITSSVLIILFPWILRGIILSGYIAYPSTIGSFPVDWKIPRPLVISEANWIQSWARRQLYFWTEVLDNRNWLSQWLIFLSKSVTIPIRLILFTIVTLFISNSINNSLFRKEKNLKWLFLIPVLASIIFWFISAPDPIFAGSSFWILAAGIATLSREHISILENRTSKLLDYVFFLIFFFFIIPFSNPVLKQSDKNSIAFDNIPKVSYETKLTDSLLNLNIPKKPCDQCWNTPLPCTPYFRPNLRLISENDISKGFVLDKTMTFADIHSTIPEGFTVSSDLGVALESTDWRPGNWYGFEEDKNIRWMKTPARLLIYTENSTVVKFSFKPYLMNINNRFGNKGQLNIFLNDILISKINVESEITSEIFLPLSPDFNIVTLELNAGNFVPSEHLPDCNDTRSLGISFYSFEITSEKNKFTR